MTATVPLRLVALLLAQVGLVALTVESIRRRDVAATVNALASLALAFVPAGIEVVARVAFGVRVSLGPTLPLWIALAGLLHVLGMLGLYEHESTPWWDHLTHALSAALVAALAYAAALGRAVPTPAVDAPTLGVVATTVGVTFAVGICWELLELGAREVGERLGIEPLLVPYGYRDTALDLLFDLVGAVAVVALDVRTFVGPLASLATLAP